MKALTLLTLLFAGMINASATVAEDTAALEAEARDLVESFVGRLKPELKSALQAGGPVNAIAVCADKAPQIADALSESSGWLVRRVSLRARNASRAIPDRWETAVLESFDRRQAAGAAPATLSYAELTPSHYRFMQAQGVEAVCLLCHGSNIDSAVAEALQTYYPDDTATGYALGQVRGAISLSKRR
jgi:hypothetical protein